MAHQVEVMRGTHKAPGEQFGPLPGYRSGNVVAYEFELPERYEPWPGRTLVERTFVLLDLGVSFANPCWARCRGPDGTMSEVDPAARNCWYVDLISVRRDDGRFVFTDLYIDVIVPTDGRHYRMLDLDEYADAVAAGHLGLDEALDGLRRWQKFLDRHLHQTRRPVSQWSDFPPSCIAPLEELPAPFGPPVRGAR